MTSWPRLVLPYIRVKYSAFFDEAKWTNYVIDMGNDSAYKLIKTQAFMAGDKVKKEITLDDSQCEKIESFIKGLEIPVPEARHLNGVCDGGEYEMVIRAPSQEVHCKWFTGAPDNWGSLHLFAHVIMDMINDLEE